MSSNIHFNDGRWVKSEQSTISTYDLALLRGFGLFDFLRTYNRQPFMLDEHMERLFNSAKQLDITVPASASEISDLVHEGIDKNPGPELGIRIVVTGGISEDSITPGEPRLIIKFTPAKTLPAEFYEQGVVAITWPTLRYMPETKSLNYMSAVKAAQVAKRSGAVEAIYTDRTGAAEAKLYEGTTSNFFGVINDVLITPDSEVLPGITKNVVLDLARSAGISIEERPVFVSEIPQLQEAILTSSVKEILPIVKIDKDIVGSGKIGPITTRLISDFKRLKQQL